VTLGKESTFDLDNAARCRISRVATARWAGRSKVPGFVQRKASRRASLMPTLAEYEERGTVRLESRVLMARVWAHTAHPG
jgi:hypothetical protein